jgi:hypothetical protein
LVTADSQSGQGDKLAEQLAQKQFKVVFDSDSSSANKSEHLFTIFVDFLLESEGKLNLEKIFHGRETKRV